MLVDHPFAPGFRLSKDFTEFEESAGPGRVAKLAPSATGDRFEYSAYGNANALTGGIEGRTASVEVEYALTVDLRPAADVRRVTVSTELAMDEGWTLGEGLYLASSAAGTWSVDADAHGAILSAHSVVAQPLQTPVLGAPSFGILNEGPGGSSTAFTIDVAAAGTMDAVFLQQFAVGLTLERAFGSPGDAYAFAGTGLVCDFPPFETRDGAGPLDVLRAHMLDLLQGGPVGAVPSDVPAVLPVGER